MGMNGTGYEFVTYFPLKFPIFFSFKMHYHILYRKTVLPTNQDRWEYIILRNDELIITVYSNRPLKEWELLDHLRVHMHK